MIFSFTTVIVEQKLLAVKIADKECRRRRQHERANIFDRLQLSQYARQTRIDRQKANLEARLLPQSVQQTRRLNSLPTQDVKRWSNNQHAQGFWARVLPRTSALSLALVVVVHSIATRPSSLPAARWSVVFRITSRCLLVELRTKTSLQLLAVRVHP